MRVRSLWHSKEMISAWLRRAQNSKVVLVCAGVMIMGGAPAPRTIYVPSISVPGQVDSKPLSPAIVRGELEDFQLQCRRGDGSACRHQAVMLHGQSDEHNDPKIAALLKRACRLRDLISRNYLSSMAH